MVIQPFEIECLNGKQIFLDGFCWNEHGLRITCMDDIPTKATIKVEIVFPPDVLSVRVIHEYQSWKIEEQIYEWKQNLGSGYNQYPMFIILESDYIEWYKSTETIDDDARLSQLKHYFFFIDDTLIEVIDDRSPALTQSPCGI